jgi:hypothetical protein
MPMLDAAVEYDHFSYDESSSRPLSLDEAVKKAAELRKADSANFYRVEATDVTATGFRVEKVSVASVYADFVSRFAQRFMRHAVSRKA